jgi:Ca2+-transporting ATPase
MAAQSFDLGGLAGLTCDDAKVRLEQEGPNELPRQKKRGLLAIVLEFVREPMFIIQ